MGVLQVRQIKAFLESTFTSFIDMSDYVGKPPEQKEVAFLSRGQAALAIMHLSGVTADIAAKSVVDGYDDNGIDAVHYDPNEQILYMVQSKWDSDGAGTIDRGEAQKFIKGIEDLVQPRFDRFNARVRVKAKEINNALDNARTRCSLVFAYTGNQTLSSHVTSDMNDLLVRLNDTSEAFTLVPLSQKELHAAISSQGQSIDLEVMIYEWAKVADPINAFCGRVRAVDIARWWNTHGVRLLSLNLRNFIGPSAVNDAMVDTLRVRPEFFWYFNNGITVLCSEVSKKLVGGADRTSGVFDCKGVSIVNGAQTVGSIAQGFAKHPDQLEKALVHARFISLKDCPEHFATDVTRAANTQNRVELRDFAALDPEQERLRLELLLEEKKIYVYKSGTYSVSQEEGCTMDEAAVAVACSLADVGLAVQAKREVSRLYENIAKPPYKLLFNATLSASKMWRCVQVQRSVESVLKEQQENLEGRERQVAVHGNRFVLHRVFKALPPDALGGPHFDVEGIRPYIREQTLTVLTGLWAAADKRFPGSYLNSLFKNQEKCRLLGSDLDQPAATSELQSSA